MALSTVLIDGKGASDTGAKVTTQGQLITAPISYNSLAFKDMTVDNQGYTFVAPKAGYKIVIPAVLINADKNVSSTTPATIDIFEAAGLDSATISSTILQVELLKNERLFLNGINLLTSEGVWINGKTTDNNVRVSLFYYYIEI